MILIYALVMTISSPSSYEVKSVDYYQTDNQCQSMLKKYKRMNFKSKIDESVEYVIGDKTISIVCQMTNIDESKQVILDK